MPYTKKPVMKKSRWTADSDARKKISSLLPINVWKSTTFSDMPHVQGFRVRDYVRQAQVPIRSGFRLKAANLYWQTVKTCNRSAEVSPLPTHWMLNGT